ncbi:MAG: sigma-54-dependent transcriptional regulator [Desulfovibrionaceae bacterium]
MMDTMDTTFKILIVEDDSQSLERLENVLSHEGYRITACAEVDAALEILEHEEFDLVMTDLRTDGKGELTILRRTKELYPNSVVIIITGSHSVERAVEAMKRGAYHYLGKPYQAEEVRVLVEKALEKRMLKLEVLALRSKVQGQGASPELIGKTPKMQELRRLIARVAPLDCTVLIRGETGTGKELVAKSIHRLSNRTDRRFLAVNCGGFTEELLSNELFGHEKEAFTGAQRTTKGILEAVDGGTLLLDEIGEMPFPTQVRLLRFMQERTFLRVGGTEELSVNVRVLAATNRSLREEVARGAFRQDLLYRLNVFTLRIPPLRERMDDMPLFCKYFIEKYGVAFERNVERVSDEVLDAFMGHSFPGNVRELENVIERAVALCEGHVVEMRHLPPRFHDLAANNVCLGGTRGAMVSLAEVEERHIRDVLHAVGGNRKRAALVLGIDRVSLWRKLKRFGLAADEDVANKKKS